ncbi:hypothetical protein [Oricola thermophila]|uniref:Uncharacterized protein n=1 Tax=Oricola thermophila TaxID=2742145 RepID=A0A6N1VFW9_9HYPH|nr:hypothetical protein [Oricola thermophila]QKV18049.1 hypothetical protein HTY61_06010 [Oricola thermophila]
MDYRELYDTRPNIHSYQTTEQSGYVGPLIALAVIVVLIASVFFLGGSGEVGSDQNPAAPMASESVPVQPAAPTAQ